MSPGAQGGQNTCSAGREANGDAPPGCFAGTAVSGALAGTCVGPGSAGLRGSRSLLFPQSRLGVRVMNLLTCTIRGGAKRGLRIQTKGKQTTCCFQTRALSQICLESTLAPTLAPLGRPLARESLNFLVSSRAGGGGEVVIASSRGFCGKSLR